MEINFKPLDEFISGRINFIYLLILSEFIFDKQGGNGLNQEEEGQAKGFPGKQRSTRQHHIRTLLTSGDQKTKLKVGKEKAKASNFTDTSFTAKTISLPNQRLVKDKDDIVKRLSLTKHHQSSTRKETLIYIEQHLPDDPSIYKQILNSVCPLCVDTSRSVREALVSLLKECAAKQPGLIELHSNSISLFVHSAMTHINPAIRNDSYKFIDILLEYGDDSFVKNSWIKTIKCFFTLLHWPLNDSKQLSSLPSTLNNDDVKSRLKILESFNRFIKSGIEENMRKKAEVITVHHLTGLYCIPSTSNPFESLKLFTNPLVTTSSTSMQCDDFKSRRETFVELFLTDFNKNVSNLVKQGGQLSKCGKELQQLVETICD